MVSSTPMKQASLDLNLSTRKTRKPEFLAQMERVVPWAALVELIPRNTLGGKNSRPPFALESMLHMHFLQQQFSLSGPAMEEVFFEMPVDREFAQLDAHGRLPEKSTVLRFRHRLEKHKLTERGLLLKAGTAVNATLIPAPSSTRNKDRARKPEMHSNKKDNQWHFGIKGHIGVDVNSGLVHTARGTSGHVGDMSKDNSLLHGKEVDAFEKLDIRGSPSEPMPRAASLGTSP